MPVRRIRDRLVSLISTARRPVPVLLMLFVGCGGGHHASSRADSPPAGQALPPRVHRSVVRFRATDGRTVKGFFSSAGPRAPGLVLVHQSDGGAEQWNEFVPYLHRAGFSTLAYDGRGGIDETQLLPEAEGALRFLTSRQHGNPPALGVVGASIGGTVALLAANGRQGQKIRAAVALSPADSGTEFHLQEAGHWHPHDVLMLSSPAEESSLENAFPGPLRSRRLIIPSGGHGVELLNDTRARSAVLEWLRRLRRSASSRARRSPAESFVALGAGTRGRSAARPRA